MHVVGRWPQLESNTVVRVPARVPSMWCDAGQCVGEYAYMHAYADHVDHGRCNDILKYKNYIVVNSQKK